ncbi:MAG: xanthine dehydrogenase family protein molybdopterin-binding subunit [Candidatus Binatia bacterium]
MSEPVVLPKLPKDLPVSEPRFVGRAVPRIEDPMLLTGRVEFIDNLHQPGMLHCAILRSPHAHARIVRVDTSAAEKLPGVAAVVTGADAKRWTSPAPTVPEGWGAHCLAVEKVRFVGEPVAAVAATSRYVAEDALELIEVEYERLPAIVDATAAEAPDAPLVFEERGNNVMLKRVFTWGDVAQAFRAADHVFTERFRWHRLGANPMETFGAVSRWDPVDGSITVHGAFQAPSQMAIVRALVFGVPSNRVNVIAHPHGGSFGGKGGGRGTDITIMLSRKAGGRPVKWVEDRMEYLTSGGGQSWDRHYDVSLAVRADGTVTGLRVKLLDDLGATAEGYASLSAAKPLTSFTGPYTIPVAEYDLTIVATNKLPGSPFRGMGPPPHNFVLEQMMDIAARGLGLDPAELRRRNFIPPDRFPYTIPSGNEYDSGNYEAALATALEMSGYARLRAEQAEARRQGRLLGIGVVSTIEPGVFDWNAYAIVGMQGTGVPEGVTLSVDLLGKLVVRVGFALEGQGQYTIAAQILADYFGVEPGDVTVVMQDTLSAPPAFGPGGSRLGVALAGAVLGAADLLRGKLVRVAAFLMQAPPEAVELMDGKFRVKGVPGAEMGLAQVAGAMLARSDLLPPGLDPNPTATYVWTAPGRTQADEQGRAKSYLTAANACHVVLIEIDRETGMVRILGYWIADDCGTRLNPANVEGQIQGGVAQGVGAALLEEYVYDEDGQILTSTFMDYLLPTINEVPETTKAALCTPSPFTPLGAKGTGEGPVHTTPAAILSAINDALAPLDVRATEVPASPLRLWRILRDARS